MSMLTNRIKTCVHKGKVYYSKTKRCRKRCRTGTAYYKGRCKVMKANNNNNNNVTNFKPKHPANFLKRVPTVDLIEEIKRRHFQQK